MTFSTIICADWGKERAKRAACVADVSTRSVRRLVAPMTFSGLLTAAEARAALGPVLLGFDVPLGVPRSLLGALPEKTFVELLLRRAADKAFYTPVTMPTAWTPASPFFAVSDSKSAFLDAALKQGVTLFRDVDRATGGNCPFITSGIPGTVGSAAVSLWQEIGQARLGGRHFSLWPFEGSLTNTTCAASAAASAPPASTAGVVVGEVYPRAAYATALLPGPKMLRPRMALSKTRAEVRAAALSELKAAPWVLQLGVSLEDIDDAAANEDAFDALVTACALLRCELEGLALSAPVASPTTEGGILGTGSINLAIPERSFVKSGVASGVSSGFVPSVAQGSIPMKTRSKGKAPTGQKVSTGPSAPSGVKQSSWACPIANCPHTFVGTRGGWDAHAASTARHPAWHPTVVDGEKRKQLFRHEYPGFFV